MSELSALAEDSWRITVIQDFAASELFDRTFQEGMDLVEETAAYLDGAGRHDSKRLPRKAALAYASESMRLTTRLMQLASWLLVQRAVREGQMPASEACQDRYRVGDESPRAAEVQAAGGVDLVLDMVGGAYTPKNIDVLKPHGRLVQIALLGGAKAEIDLGLIMRKRLTLTGSTLRPRPPEDKARLARGVEQTVWPWIEAGRFRPIVDSAFPLAEAAKAHARIDDGGHLGKIVLTVGARLG